MLSHSLLVLSLSNPPSVNFDSDAKISGIIVGLAFIFTFFSAQHSALGQAALSVSILILFEPPNLAGATVEEWLFERIFLTFLGALLVPVFHLPYWVCFPPLAAFERELNGTIFAFNRMFERGWNAKHDAEIRVRIARMEDKIEQAMHVPRYLRTVANKAEYDRVTEACIELVESWALCHQSSLTVSHEGVTSCGTYLSSVASIVRSPTAFVGQDYTASLGASDSHLLVNCCRNLWVSVATLAVAVHEKAAARSLQKNFISENSIFADPLGKM